MKVISNIRYYFLLVILLTASSAAFGQEKEKSKNYEFCSDNWNWSNGDKVSARDLRETTFAAPGILNVDAGKNGGISVRGENRSDVLVRACVQAWGASQEEADSIVRSVRVQTGSTVRADSSTGSENFSVSYQILVPRSMNVDLKAHNGGISLSSVEGSLKFETTNGGVSLSDLAGDVKGRTTNGGVKVSLSGDVLARKWSRCRNDQRRRETFDAAKLRGERRNRNGQRRIQKRHRRAFYSGRHRTKTNGIAKNASPPASTAAAHRFASLRPTAGSRLIRQIDFRFWISL